MMERHALLAATVAGREAADSLKIGSPLKTREIEVDRGGERRFGARSVATRYARMRTGEGFWCQSARLIE
jgi:hypothetical protein